MKNKITVTQYSDLKEAEKALEDRLKNQEISLLYGLWLEGADWDGIKLVEQREQHKIRSKFPVLELTHVELPQDRMNFYDDSDH